MRKLGRKQLTLQLQAPLAQVPPGLEGFGLELAAGGQELTYTYDTKCERLGIVELLDRLSAAGIEFTNALRLIIGT